MITQNEQQTSDYYWIDRSKSVNGMRLKINYFLPQSYMTFVCVRGYYSTRVKKKKNRTITQGLVT